MESTKEVLVTRTVNLLKFDGSGTATANGITVTRNATENSITITGGTPTAQTSSFLTKVLTLPAGSYVLYCPELQAQVESIYGLYIGKESATQIAAIWSSTKYRATFTLTEETKLWVWASFNTAGSYDNKVIHAMIFEGNDTTDLPDFEPYYHEYESTKEVVVRRSNNLFLPFTSDSNMQIDVPFSWSGTDEPLMTCTLQKDGNIRMKGTVTKGAGGGWVSITNLTGGLIFKAGKTYNFSINPDCQCTMQLFRQKDGAWETIYQFSGTWAGGATTTFTEDTIPTRIFMSFSSRATVKAGDEIDVLINPMLVEGDTKQDYEPYYYEAEASKTGIYPTDTSLTSIVDFSGSLYNKILLDSGNLANNDVWATTKDLTPCVAGTTYWYKANMLKNTKFRLARALFYDSNKNVIGKKVDLGSSWGDDTSVVAPEGAVYMRITYSRMGTTTDDPYPINPIIYVAETTQEEA